MERKIPRGIRQCKWRTRYGRQGASHGINAEAKRRRSGKAGTKRCKVKVLAQRIECRSCGNSADIGCSLKRKRTYDAVARECEKLRGTVHAVGGKAKLAAGLKLNAVHCVCNRERAAPQGGQLARNMVNVVNLDLACQTSVVHGGANVEESRRGIDRGTGKCLEIVRTGRDITHHSQLACGGINIRLRHKSAGVSSEIQIARHGNNRHVRLGGKAAVAGADRGKSIL